MGNSMMTSIYGDGFIPISTLTSQCIGINVESIGIECTDDAGLRIVGTLVPRSPRGCGKESIGARYLEARAKYLESRRQTSIYKKIIINPPATIVIWNDGTKTVVKATENDIYDPEKGVALCFLKKYFGSSYKHILKDANDIYNEKMEEDLKSNCDGFNSGINSGFKDAVLQASVTSVIKSINDAARKAFLGDEKKEDGGDK